MSEYTAGLLTGIGLSITAAIIRHIWKSYRRFRYSECLCREDDECQCALRGE